MGAQLVEDEPRYKSSAARMTSETVSLRLAAKRRRRAFCSRDRYSEWTKGNDLRGVRATWCLYRATNDVVTSRNHMNK